MVARGVGVSLAALVLLAPSRSAASSISDEPEYVYPGLVFDIVVTVDEMLFMRRYDQIEVSLPDHYELLDVVAYELPGMDDPEALLAADSLEQCDFDEDEHYYYGCPASGFVGPGSLAYYTVYIEADGTRQTVRVTNGFLFYRWEHAIHLVVLARAHDCDQPTEVLFTGPSDPDRTLYAVCSVNSPTVTGLDVDGSSPVSITRRGDELPVNLLWVPVGLPVELTDPFEADVEVKCAPEDEAWCCRATPDNPNQCEEPGRVLEIVGTTYSPSGVQLRALNRLPDPPESEPEITLDAQIGGLEFSEVAQIRISREPFYWVTNARTSADGNVSPGAVVSFAVQEATNEQRGVEPGPWLVQWQVEYHPDFTPPGDWPAADVWWSSTAALPAAQFEITIANDAALVQRLWDLPGGERLKLAVRGTPPGMPDAMPPQVNLLEVVVDPGEAPVADKCALHASDTTLGLGEEIALELVVEQDDGSFAPVETGIEWGVEGAGGSVTGGSAPGAATYRAPYEIGTATVTAVLSESGLCEHDTYRVDLTVEQDIRVDLSIDRRTTQPGGLVVLLVKVETSAGARVDDLLFLLDHDPALEALQPAPSSHDSSVSVHAAQPVKQGLSFTGDFSADGSHLLRLPFYARPSAACRRAKVSVAVLRRLGDAPLGQDRETVVIACDPELFEATLMGKVFSDHNGNGTQEQGEPGIPGVMVALSASVYARTDEHGRYHIPRLNPGRVAVKLNESTLPIGARVNGVATRAVTLTPGMFTRVTYAVETVELGAREQLAFSRQGSGVRLVETGPVYGARFATRTGVTLTAYRGEQVVAAREDEDAQLLALPLTQTTTRWLVTERETNGRVSVYSFGIHVHEEDNAALILPHGPRLLARFVVPPDNEAARTGQVAIEVSEHGAGKVRFRTVDFDGEEHGDCKGELEAPTVEGERLRCVLPLTGNTERLAVRLDPAVDAEGDDPEPLQILLPLKARDTEHFLVALGGSSFGCDPQGNLDSQRGNIACYADGGGAFFYRGDFGALSLTAGADAAVRGPFGSERNWATGDSALTYLLGHDPTRVFRDLDPESYFPTYGDESVVVDERGSGGRFFFRLQYDDDFLRWGGLNTGIGAGKDEDEVEAGRYERSLYGLGGRLTLGEYADPDSWGVKAVAFGAQPYTAAARDEITITGGSLYFLSYRDIAEGSVRVTLEVLDEISELPIRRVPLTEGIDFEVDHIGGRLTLDPVLAQRYFGDSLTTLGSGGPEGRLVVTYEYLPTANPGRDLTVGGRVVGRYGPVALGATYVTELQGLDQPRGDLQRYQLVGATARLDLGEVLGVDVDFAHSRGGSHDMGRSYDGGLGYDGAEEPSRDAGVAVAAKVTTEVAGLKGQAYGRFFEPGFSDSRWKPGRRLVQAGLVMAADFETGTAIKAQYDYRLSRYDGAPGPTPRNLALLNVTQKIFGLELGVEGRYVGDPRADEHRVILGAQAGYRFIPELLVMVRRRQRLYGDSPFGDAATGETAIGGSYGDDDRWCLGAELGLDDEANLFGRVQGGLPVADDTEIYAGFLRGSRLGTGLTSEGDEQKSRLVTGGRRRHQRGVSLFAENAIEERSGDQITSRTVGGELAISKRTAITFHYQRGASTRDEAGESGGRTVRDAASLGGAFAAERVKLQLAVDVRVDQETLWQLGVRSRGELRATDALTLALGVRGGSTFAIPTTRAMRGAWEGSAGFALRPVDSDFVNAFGRYALVIERDGAEATDAAQTISHVGSLVLIFEVIQPLAVGTKVAYRHTEVALLDTAARRSLEDDALIAALRGDLHLNEMWDATVEGRLCASPTTGDDPTAGVLAEVSVLLLGWMRLGAGYNFSDISAQGIVCREPGARGFFVRAEAMY